MAAMELAVDTRPKPDLQVMNSREQLVTNKPFRLRKRRVDILVATFLILLVVTAVIVAVVLGTTNPVARGRDATPQLSKTEKARDNGVKWLLSRRNKNWGWGKRLEAEAVMAVILADDSWLNWSNADTVASINRMHIDILAALAKNATLDTPDWYGGKLAQYVCALVATCSHPRDFYGFDLVNLLEDHVANYPKHDFNHNFAFAWGVLALCNAGGTVKTEHIEQLTNSAGNYSFGVEEAALTVMALRCLEPDVPSVGGAISQGKNHLLSAYNPVDHSFGDVHQTAWAAQALNAIGGYSNLTNQSNDFLVSKQGKDGSFAQVSTTVQVLPSLAGRSYFDIKNMSKTMCRQSTIPTTTTSPTRYIRIKVTVVSDLVNTTAVNSTFSVEIPAGASLFDALVLLQQNDASFSFSSTSSQWGEQVTSVMGVASGSSTRTYWMTKKLPDEALTVSVDNFKPTDGSHIEFRLTSY
ncbi:gastric intrinsic factor [Lingula anatina]|uniref:Gastric intrinsic factor n=1 Tax=Lingula anatina TaxID=7574 RepID=A0A1S3HBR9_LINAN|nr:gastric intrinsic factor [Lingula anatina]XP_013383458.1 gastric intrinsic factor [Lingula anatina]XP_013383459.1 gastric intrinsic factor [Lingula anatina]|eukprot:XP_013383457.1 gastric intrinsic factor [Lingula anatina]